MTPTKAFFVASRVTPHSADSPKPPPLNHSFSCSKCSCVSKGRLPGGISAGREAERSGRSISRTVGRLIPTKNAFLGLRSRGGSDERMNAKTRQSRSSGTGARDRRERYHSVLRTVKRNTGFRQRAGMRPVHVLAFRCRAGDEKESVKSAIQAAVDNGDLFVYHDDEGHERVALATPTGLRQVIAEQNLSDDPDLELIERCVDRIEEVGG